MMKNDRYLLQSSLRYSKSHSYSNISLEFIRELQYLQVQFKINSDIMGQEQPPPKTYKQSSIEDNIIQMKMQSKALSRAAKKSEKEAAAYQKKAKDALRKNNEESAKMYLMSASQKSKEAMNCERTAIRMQLMCGQIKSLKNNEKVMQNFSAMTQAVSNGMNGFDATKMMGSMEVLNNKMDELMINNKMMGEIMAGSEVAHQGVAEDMLSVLKQEIAMEQKHKIEGIQVVGGEKQYNKQKKEENDDFLNELKGL